MSDSSDLQKVVCESVRVPNWLLGMPEDWWDIYFDRVDQFVISPVWGHA